MAVLSMNNIEKNAGDHVLLPAFNLDIDQGEVTAIYSTLNVRQTLLGMFIGDVPITNGELIVNGENPFKSKSAYFKQIGVLFLKDGLYERLTVRDNFKFYRDLYTSNQTLDQILKVTQLEARRYIKSGKLTDSEKRRVQFAKILFQNPQLFIFEEPDLNVDVETKRIFLTMINRLRQMDKAVIILTSNMENAITASDKVYHLNDQGLHTVEINNEEMSQKDSQVNEEPEITSIQFNKIPTKINDKMVLFDPPEIDYIESHGGQSNLYIKGEVFPCVFTLNELEERLKPYGFFRCHRSYIVNLQKVREVITWTRNSFSLILDDKLKSSIPLSKTKMAQLKEMLGLK